MQLKHVERAPKNGTASGPWRAIQGALAHPGVVRACLIANMAEELLVLAPKKGPLEHFRVNRAQALLLDFVAERWSRGLPVYALVPKARQLGVSTFVQAFLFVLCLVNEKNGKPYRCATVAHIEDSAKSIFSMTRLFERKLPKTWRLPIESSQQGRLEWSGGSRNQVVSAKLGDAALKGVTLNAFHGSEVANWADLGMDPNALWSSAWGAIAQDENAFVVLESTAKGRDPFFHGLVSRSRSNHFEFPVVFIPWFFDEKYTMSWGAYRASRPTWHLTESFVPETGEVLAREFLGQRIVKPGDEWCVFRHELTDDQLIWRRSVIEKLGSGDTVKGLDLFRRYYPSTLEECWAANEYSFLGDDSEKHLERLSRTVRQPQRGELRDGGWVPSSLPNAILRWHEPQSGHAYVIGADCSEGLATGDGQAAYVIDRDTREMVAAVCTKLEPDAFSSLLERLGRYYWNATIAVENNFSPSVVVAIQKSGYPKVYWHRDPDQLRGRPPRPGFNTNKRTRPVILDVLSATLRSGDFTVYDEKLLEELRTFVWSEKRETFCAPKAFHDDRVMALAIAVYVCGWRDDAGRRKKDAEAVPDFETTDRGFLAWKREQKRAKQRLRERAGPGPRCAL